MGFQIRNIGLRWFEKKPTQYYCFPPSKLVKTDSADMYQRYLITTNVCLSITPSPPPPPTFTQSSGLSVHQHKLNLLLMIVLLTRRGSIHSCRPATTGLISWSEGTTTKGQRATGRWSWLYLLQTKYDSGLNKGEPGRVLSS